VTEPDFVDALGPALAGALEKRGFTSLTPVQETVLDPALEGRDLRITSQTGSGKTVAIGFTIRDLVGREANRMGGVAHPYAILVAPTRELAKQVDEELSWLFAPLGARVVSVTGGTSARDERRALAMGPQVIVGTPGRLLDHLDRGAIDASEVGAVILDEADRLLDLGFRDELDAIFAHMPEERRTHLVSATFPREVRSLADAVQRDAAHVEGTRLGEANTDIDHVLHLVDGRDRLSAVINLLLAHPDEQTLVFARTRADVGEIADSLAAAGFPASSLSGEMEQAQRDRALSAFKRGDLRVLVATDVAARGIDVVDIARVIHADPPGDSDTYTHRSGRTGRAGNKGISSTLVPPSIMAKVVRLLQRAGVKYRFEKIPSADDIRRTQDDHLIAELTHDPAADAATEAADATDSAVPEGEPAKEAAPAKKKPSTDRTGPMSMASAPAAEHEGEPAIDPRTYALAQRLANAGNVERTIARLLMRFRQAAGPEPRFVRPIEPPSEVGRTSRRNPGLAPGAPSRSRRGDYEERPARPRRSHDDVVTDHDMTTADRGPADAEPGSFDSRPPPSSRAPRDLSRPWSLFQVTWGDAHGADTRRLLAMLCRRGGIESRDVGSIRIGRVASTVEIAADVADQFAEAAGKIDKRDPRIVIRPTTFGPPTSERRPERPQFEGRPERPAFENRYPSDRPQFEGRPERPAFENRYPSDRPQFEGRPERPAFENRYPSDRPQFEARRGSDRPPFEARHPSERPPFEARPPGKKAFPKKPYAPKKPFAKPFSADVAPEAPPPPVAPAPPPPVAAAPVVAAPEAAATKPAHAKAPRSKAKADARDVPKKGWVIKRARPTPTHGDAPPKRRVK